MNETKALVKRLRRAADAISDWDPDERPLYTDWSSLMEDAADAIEALEDDFAVTYDDEPEPCQHTLVKTVDEGFRCMDCNAVVVQRTKTGKVVTPADISQWVEEAERGFTICPRHHIAIDNDECEICQSEYEEATWD